MLTAICPKLPSRNIAITRDYYTNKLGFREWGNSNTANYLMLEKDKIQIHFFEHKYLDPLTNYGQLYIRVQEIDKLFRELSNNKTAIHPNGHLENKAWGQREFSLLDPDNNLLTFGQEI
jgi:catechol 2,3-dioxygenase-like lactoylglutathione lyase family enzyme